MLNEKQDSNVKQKNADGKYFQELVIKCYRLFVQNPEQYGKYMGMMIASPVKGSVNFIRRYFEINGKKSDDIPKQTFTDIEEKANKLAEAIALGLFIYGHIKTKDYADKGIVYEAFLSGMRIFLAMKNTKDIFDIVKGNLILRGGTYYFYINMFNEMMLKQIKNDYAQSIVKEHLERTIEEQKEVVSVLFKGLFSVFKKTSDIELVFVDNDGSKI